MTGLCVIDGACREVCRNEDEAATVEPSDDFERPSLMVAQQYKSMHTEECDDQSGLLERRLNRVPALAIVEARSRRRRRDRSRTEGEDGGRQREGEEGVASDGKAGRVQISEDDEKVERCSQKCNGWVGCNRYKKVPGVESTLGW